MGISMLLPVILQRPAIALFSLCAVAVGIVYSFKPLRFSGRPAADFLSNAFGYGVIAFGVGWYLAGMRVGTWTFACASFPYFIAMCGGSISSTLPDCEGDRREGKRTTAVVLGKRNAHLLATFFITAGAGSAYALGDWIALIWTCAALPIYFMCGFNNSPRLVEATYKVSGALGMVLISLLFVSFAPAALAVLIATRLYFRLRFNVSYPSLLPTSHA